MHGTRFCIDSVKQHRQRLVSLQGEMELVAGHAVYMWMQDVCGSMKWYNQTS